MKKIYLAILIAVLISGCARLDDFMFNEDNSISEYRLDAYEGDVDILLDASYDISDSLIHRFICPSSASSNKKLEKPSEIHAVYIGNINRIATDTVIVYCHGNRDHMDFYWNRAKLLASCGGKNRFGVLMMDYSGYGLSESEPSEEELNYNVLGTIDWLEQRGLTKERMVLYGFSMGSAPATSLANQASWLILENPFASAEVMVQDAALLAMPSSFVLNGSYDNAEKIKKVEIPFLWLHGKADDFLSIETHGEVVYKNYSGPKGKAERVDGAGHGDLPALMGPENYLTTIKDFLMEK